MSPIDKFYQLINEAYDLKPSPVAVTLAEEAVRLADVHLPIELRFIGRSILINVCFAGGKPVPMLAAIAWSLGVVDREEYVPDSEELESLLWQCKHAVTYSSCFASISYKQFSGLLADVLKRYQAVNASPRSVYMITSSSELFMGHFDAADDCLQKGRVSRRDRYAETPAWELFFEVDHLVARDQDAEALERLRPMLKDPFRAMDVDPWFVGMTMFELLRQGEREDAIRHHKRALKKISGNSKYTSHTSRHISFLSIVGENEKALKLLEAHLEIGLTAPDHSSRLDFCLNSWVLMRRLINAGRNSLKIRFPNLKKLAGPDGARVELPQEPSGSAGTYDLEILAAWFEEDFTQITNAFNERNGNQFLDRQIRQAKELVEWE